MCEPADVAHTALNKLGVDRLLIQAEEPGETAERFGVLRRQILESLDRCHLRVDLAHRRQQLVRTAFLWQPVIQVIGLPPWKNLRSVF